MKKQPEIHSRQKYFASLVDMDRKQKDRSKSRQKKKGRKKK